MSLLTGANHLDQIYNSKMTGFCFFHNTQKTLPSISQKFISRKFSYMYVSDPQNQMSQLILHLGLNCT